MINMIFNSERRTACKSIQSKKHYTQMNTQEKEKCINLIRMSHQMNDYFRLSSHAEGKLVTYLNFNNLLGMLYSEDSIDYVIEYNETIKFGNTYKRVLLRHPNKVKVNGVLSYLYLVIEAQTGIVVTAYYNRVTDTHKTLDLDYYQEDLKIIK